jgi:exopolyphosphatase
VLVVRDNVRIDEEQANSLFETVCQAIEADEGLNVKPWKRANELAKRQMVWVQGEESDAGRKVVRPLVEKAVESWDMPRRVASSDVL